MRGAISNDSGSDEGSNQRRSSLALEWHSKEVLMASCMQRTDQRSSKSQPGVQVKKATISEGLELRELE
jgi:hypothetical protein